jgi:hypothetical protein
MELFTEAGTLLAKRDFARNPLASASPVLEEHIENWAVGCYLANRPARQWWIFGIAKIELARIGFGPLGEVEDEPEGPWRTVPVAFVEPTEFAIDDSAIFTVPAWNPTEEPSGKYRKRTLNNLKRDIDAHISYIHRAYRAAGFEPTVDRRELTHFTWLARHQILGESFEQIAQTPGKHVDPGTVKTTVIDLRKSLGLPSRRRPGRPKK